MTPGFANRACHAVKHQIGGRWYTSRMPTALKRHQVTEVPELRHALEVARLAWPEEKSTTQFIYRLASAGAERILEDPGAARRLRMAKIQALAGRYPASDPDYLEGLRREWDR